MPGIFHECTTQYYAKQCLSYHTSVRVNIVPVHRFSAERYLMVCVFFVFPKSWKLLLIPNEIDKPAVNIESKQRKVSGTEMAAPHYRENTTTLIFFH